MQSEVERVSITSLNVFQTLFGVSSASLRTLDFWAPKKLKRFLPSAEFRFPLGILLDQFLRRMLLPDL
jgi:hypothetical protein